MSDVQAFYREMNNTFKVPESLWDNIPKVSENAAVIFEPRVHPNLPFTLRNHMYYLAPYNFSLTIFHSKENERQVKEITGDRPNINFICFCEGNSTRDIYNDTLKTVEFYESIPCNRMLIFQTDSWLRNFGIDKFFDYGYIGAPHDNREGATMNGGLSLRNKQVCIDIIKKYNNKDAHQWEDSFFSYGCLLFFPELFPKLDSAKQFSSCWQFDERSIGVHQFWDCVVDPVKRKTLMTLHSYTFEVNS
uniref:DUF5672 domain-containing protein n=1 Tax=viral metagenome TaxID=1070528 RepID=A0A6C0F6V7_9ZZZZ